MFINTMDLELRHGTLAIAVVHKPKYRDKKFMREIARYPCLIVKYRCNEYAAIFNMRGKGQWMKHKSVGECYQWLKAITTLEFG